MTPCRACMHGPRRRALRARAPAARGLAPCACPAAARVPRSPRLHRRHPRGAPHRRHPHGAPTCGPPTAPCIVRRTRHDRTALTGYSFAIAVAADAPWKSLPELIADARANPGRISYGTVGKGSTGHIAMERLARAAGVRLNFVPFKGAAEELTALIGGHIGVVSDAGWGAQVQAGRVRLLASYTAERPKRLPQVPTARELGYDVVATSLIGIAGPKGMDPALVRTLHDALRAASRDPAWLAVLDTENQPDLHLDSAAYGRYAAEQFESDRRFIRELGITLD
jgi:tripartite-type tricarboxylate transporter receptor subunit TctC